MSTIVITIHITVTKTLKVLTSASNLPCNIHPPILMSLAPPRLADSVPALLSSSATLLAKKKKIGNGSHPISIKNKIELNIRSANTRRFKEVCHIYLVFRAVIE